MIHAAGDRAPDAGAEQGIGPEGERIGVEDDEVGGKTGPEPAGHLLPAAGVRRVAGGVPERLRQWQCELGQVGRQ